MKNKILIVDDLDLNRQLLINILQTDYDIIEAEDGDVALDMIHEHKDELSAILLDLIMPKVDGFQVLETLGKEKLSDSIPVLIISGENTPETEARCFELGIADFIGKPYHKNIVKKRLKNIIDYYAYKNALEQKVHEQTTILRKQFDLLRSQAERLHRRNEEIVDILGTVVEYRSLESGEHIKRVKSFTNILGEQFMKDYPEYHITPDLLAIITSASALHDVGKIAISDNILLKPGRLTDEEFSFMKTHTVRGCEILNDIKDVWDEEYNEVCYDICRYHHERYDGKGYPEGLKGDEIPISAQLVSVADVYDALTNERCYKKAFPTDVAYNMIINGECGVFSPKLIAAFKKVRGKFENLIKDMKNSSL